MTFPPPPPWQPPSPPPSRRWRTRLLIRLGVAAVAAVIGFTTAASHHHTSQQPTFSMTLSPVTPPLNPLVPSPTRKRVPRMVDTKVGEKTSFTSPDSTGGPDVEFTVTKITVNGRCTAPYAQKAENGHFLFLEMSIRTAPTMTGLYASNLFNPLYFSVVSPDGTVEDGDSIASSPTYGCLPDSKRLPLGLEPGRTYQATIVLDAHNIHGKVRLAPAGGLLDTDGWQWQLGEAA